MSALSMFASRSSLMRSLRAAQSGGRTTVVLAVSLVCLFAFSVAAASAAAETATYSATETVPVPPASNFHGNGGGDGWAVALSNEAVYNVFHHQDTIQVACHYQSNAEPCYPAETITEPGTNAQFASSGQPGLYLNNATGKLYVYATREEDSTAGVLCINTEEAKTNTDPFCGFTALTAKGDAPLQGGISGTSNPMLVGQRWYAFNYVNGAEQEGTKNTLMCFDVSTGEACAGQPFDVSLGSGTVVDGGFPSPATAAIGSKVIIPLEIGSLSRLACFDDSTQSSCGGKWPVDLSVSYASEYGAPFPLLDATGAIIGLCLPTGTDQCFNLEGEETATPSGMASVVSASTPWNGPALVLGPRVYVPNGNTEEVECFDYSKDEGCANFPKGFSSSEFDYLYTVNPDPQRPTCIWVNSDAGGGTLPEQIVSFDAYTGEACGQGTIRVLASQFVVPSPQCTPANYVSLQVLKPERGTYTNGTVSFDDGDGNAIAGLNPITLDGTGTASLAGLSLNTSTGLPQFLFTLEGESGPIGEVEVKLTWQGNYEATCAEGGRAKAPEVKPAETKVTTTPAATTVTTPPMAKAGVLAFGVAHLASSASACVASTGYLASVSGKLIASVTFTLGGHKLATVRKANSHGAFTDRVKLPVGSKQKLVIKVVYTAASKVHTSTITRSLARCAAVHHVSTPRFTG
jgi:hypothetical protein